MIVDQDADGTWWVVDGKKKLAGPFDTNASAFKWVDRNDRRAAEDEDRRLRIAASFSDPNHRRQPSKPVDWARKANHLKRLIRSSGSRP